MLLRNHGMITCGKTIMEAMFRTYHLEMACKAQCLALQSSQELIFPPEKICQQTVKDLLSFEANLGERDWHAWIRMLKN
jgi:ribulose-5-phosphate 4-epimerase/fuculose-1-phosphate aldolase